MDHDQPTGPDSLSEQLENLAQTRRVRFLAELHSGRDPRIEDFMVDVTGIVRPVILKVLIEAELEWRRNRNEQIDSAAWHQRFPSDRALVDDILGHDQPTVSMESSTRAPGHFEASLPADLKVGEPTESRRYKVVRRHAKGGLGVVNLAIDHELHRDVALKEIRPDSADNVQYRARFLREAEVTARLEHPGIVPVYGIGQHDDGRPYYIMRFIRGETLKSAILRLHNLNSTAPTDHNPDGPRPIKYTLHGLAGRLVVACQAIAYAHDRKILHRDIKPDNIMLGPFGETLVVDWGLAKLLDDLESDEPNESLALRTESDGLMPTEYGSKLGTVGYMSPEQAAGNVAELRPTSDVYSLGVTLYQMMTGQTPFDGTGQEEFLARVRRGNFRTPSEIKPSVPRALEAICLKAMALEPADRYPTAEALAEEIERWRAGEPVEAYGEPRLDRFARWSKRHRTLLATAMALLVSSTIGLAFVNFQEHQKNETIRQEMVLTRTAEAKARDLAAVADDARAVSEEERDIAQKNLAMTRRALREIMDRLSIPELAFLARAAGPRLSMAQNVLGFYGDLITKHPDDLEVKYELAIASRTTANIARSVGLFDEAHKHYQKSNELLDTLLAASEGSNDYRIELAQTIFDRASNFLMSGYPREAEARVLRGIEILAGRTIAAVDFDDRYRRTKALGLMELACSRLEMSRPLDAMPDLTQSLETLKSLAESPAAGPFDQIYYIHAVINRALVHSDLGKLDQARNDFAEAEKRTRTLLESPANDTPNLRFVEALINNRLGRLHAMEDRHEDSLSSFDKAFRQIREMITKGFEPIFMERELAAAWLGRAEARLELLGPEPDANQLEAIQQDLKKAIERLEILVDSFSQHHDYRGLLGQAHAASARLARLENDLERSGRHLEKACEQTRLACELNPDERGYRESMEKFVEELKRFQASRPAQTPSL